MTEPVFEINGVRVFHGDSIAVLRDLPAESVDSVVCDPPYNLSDSGKRDADCLRRILADVTFPDDQQRDVELGEPSDLASPSVSGASLGGQSGTVGVDARVGVPEGPIDLESATVVEPEVEGGDVPTAVPPEEDLPLVADAERVESLGDYVLQLADPTDPAFCDGTCRCFTEPGTALFAVPVALTGPAGRDLAGDPFRTRRRSDQDVGLGDDPLREAQGAPLVVAGAGAVVRAVLRLDLRRRTAELDLAHGTAHDGPVLLLVPAKDVGASARARGLTAETESTRVRVVDDLTDRTFALHVPWHSLNRTGQAKGFMGRAWDGWESPAAFQRWCAAWSAECLRVLKPGGHLLAFGSTRTWHRLQAGVEDAGFEIRDGLMWIYSQGFAKGRNVSKAIDKAAGAERVVTREAAAPSDPGGACEFDQRSSADRERRDLPVTEEARRWQGWNTALKPAVEPIVVARKPFRGPVEQNVLTHGTGAINIDACRVAMSAVDAERIARGNAAWAERDLRLAETGTPLADVYGTYGPTPNVGAHEDGRWPPNVLLGHAGIVDPATGEVYDACEDGCVDGRQVAELDASGGVTTSRQGARRGASTRGTALGGGALEAGDRDPGFGDTGGLSRMFPVFRYQSKAATRERPMVDGTQHNTVKPAELISWLVRLVTQPGGVCLDPFAGSGTTGTAAAAQGFQGVLVEREPSGPDAPDHIGLIRARLERKRRTPAKDRAPAAPAGQDDLFAAMGDTG